MPLRSQSGRKADQHQRAELIRRTDNAVLISIHQNCYPDRKPSGAQVLYAASPGSDALGSRMHDNLVAYLDPQNRRVAVPISEKIYLMREVNCPQCWLSAAFYPMNPSAQSLKDGVYQTKLAAVIIASYLQYRQSSAANRNGYMKAKSSTKTVFYCSECGNETAKWMGQCPACGAWNTLVEAPKEPKMSLGTRAKRIAQPKLISELDVEEELRFSTGIGEFDRVLGGGAVRGSLVLVGGAPGIGKSTLLLQLCGRISEQETILYVSGEESQRQLKMRAQRLGVDHGSIYVLAETDLNTVLLRSMTCSRPS